MSVQATEAAVADPIRFQGQYADAETGLHYNRFRYYDPIVARYLSPDPIGLAGGPNAYAYVPDPTTWVDPLGLATTPCTFDWKAGRLREVATGRFHPWRADPKTYMSRETLTITSTRFVAAWRRSYLMFPRAISWALLKAIMS